jgi:hypothetical protein
MALIVTDPTLLLAGNSDLASTPGAELVINTTTKTIQIVPGEGDLDAVVGGVTGQALYSALKILWRNSSTFIKFPFPMESITPEQFEFINGWSLADATTRKAIRTAGWVERNLAGNIIKMFAGIISLGSMGENDQPYYQQVNGGVSTNFQFTGPVNEAVQILDDPNGDGNYADGYDRKEYMKLFVREYQKVYSQSQLSDIGVTSMTYIVYRFPLSNTSDLKISQDDTAISTTEPYTNIDITYYDENQDRTIGSTDYPFRVIIDGQGATAEQIYMKVQYLLRQNSDIDEGADDVTGKTADALLRFVGDTLVTSKGVYIDNFNSNDTNRIDFYDYNDVKRNFPFVAAGTLNFGSNAVSDVNSKYWLFFETGFGTDSAIIVKDANSNDITGSVTGANISFTFAYDSNVQGGRTAGTDANVRLVVSGLGTSQYSSTNATITRATGLSITSAPALERNYQNS